MTESLQSAAEIVVGNSAADNSAADNSATDIIVGKVGAPRGLDGTVRIIPLTDFAGRFDDVTEISVGGRIYAVEAVKHISGNLFMKFSGVDSREAARTLTNKFLTVDRDNLAPLAEDEFYTFDIIGCEVFADDEKIGTVTDVLKTGSNDVLEIDGKTLIPALKSIVLSIDVAAQKILLDRAAIED